MAARVLLAPLDPVHDVGLKLIRKYLVERGHRVVLLPPDLSPEEVVQAALADSYDALLVSRTIGYEAAATLARLADLLDVAGLRPHLRVAVGGMAVRPELAAEMGYDAGFGPGTPPEAAVAFVEGKPVDETGAARAEPVVAGVAAAGGSRPAAAWLWAHSYEWRDNQIGRLARQLGEGLLAWTEGAWTPATERAALLQDAGPGAQFPEEEYLALCSPEVVAMRRGELPPGCRRVDEEEAQRLLDRLRQAPLPQLPGRPLLQRQEAPLAVFVQYGTGCPLMDAAHAGVALAWGADGTVHFDPAWGARHEGLPRGLLSWSADGTFPTAENLSFYRQAVPGGLWQVRAHRGLNTPEMVVLAAWAGADLTKINPVYGSLGGGTDPERLLVDAVSAMRLAAWYRLPFDVVTNEELGGVPAHKALAGMLVVVAAALQLGARPILQPLFCYSPEAMLEGYMDHDYVDWNAAKVMCLQEIIDAPMWVGAPIGFLTHTEERVQSATTTALHALLAAWLQVDAITIASTDEAYSRGPITAASRVDSLRAVTESWRFSGPVERLLPSSRAREMAVRLGEGIQATLAAALEKPSFCQAIYDGVFGTREEGGNPGRAGQGTVSRS